MARLLMWSPTNHIVFSSDREGDFDIWAVHVGTGILTHLTTDVADDLHPSWSGDSHVVFDSARSGNGDLYRTSYTPGAHTESGTVLLLPTTAAKEAEADVR